MAKFKITFLVKCLLTILLIFVDGTFSVSFDEDVTLTKSQQLALQKFKARVEHRLEHDWMKEDINLVRFLRARKFDVGQAETFLDNYLRWRKEVNFDRVHEENFSDLEFEYPYELEGFDKEGRPLLLWYLSDWDVRKAAISGKLEKLMRYTDRMWDECRIKIQDLQAEGKNVTRFTILFEVSKINLRQHVNPPSMPFYVTETLSYDQHFPGLGDKIWLFNTPQVFETVLNLVMPLMTPETRNSFQIYGQNKEQWLEALRKHVDPDQVPQTFGGTKISKFGY